MDHFTPDVAVPISKFAARKMRGEGREKRLASKKLDVGF